MTAAASPLCWRCREQTAVVFDGTKNGECAECAGQTMARTRSMLRQIDDVVRQGLPAWPKIADRVEFIRECIQMHRENRTTGLTISMIQRVDVERANRWHGGDFRNWSGLEWAGALCGEAGEAANVAKKLKRVESEIDGNAWSERPLVPDELVAKLAGECADTFLYLCLLAARYDIDLESAVREKFNAKSAELGYPERLP